MILYAHTLTNPNDNNDRFIKIKIINNGQEVTASFINPINLDAREQRPNIKIGTEVVVMVDEISNYTVIGSTSLGNELSQKKIYKIENSDEVEILTDKSLNINSVDGGFIEQTTVKTNKLKIENSTAELMQTLSDTLQALIDLEMIGNLGQPVFDSPTSKTTFTDLKTKLDSFI